MRDDITAAVHEGENVDLFTVGPFAVAAFSGGFNEYPAATQVSLLRLIEMGLRILGTDQIRIGLRPYFGIISGLERGGWLSQIQLSVCQVRVGLTRDGNPVIRITVLIQRL